MMMMASSSLSSSSSSSSRWKQQQQTWCSQYSQPLEPLMEGPDPNMQDEERTTSYDHHNNRKDKDISSGWEAIRDWFRMHKEKAANFALIPGVGDEHIASAKTQDLRLLLSVLGCPLAPIPLHNTNDYHHPTPLFDKRNIPLETCKAHYIIQQYLAATGCLKKRQGRQCHQQENMYATGTVKMICCETEVVEANKANSNSHNVKRLGKRRGENGRFVLWQMMPGMWSLELVLGSSLSSSSSSSSSSSPPDVYNNNINNSNKVVAGSDGKIVWRHTPWLGTHAAKGPQRPLRRIIQGLDPKSTSSLFEKAECLGERRIGEEDCFVLKVAADRTAVMERSEGPAEVIRHVLYGYFSQKTGLLIYLEDSHLTRVLQSHPTPNSNGYEYDNNNHLQTDDDVVYWETTIGSSIGDYRDVDGKLIAHQGRSIATVFRFADHEHDHHDLQSQQQYMYSRTRMEEIWRIDDVAFNVPGLSIDCFIPPSDLYF